MRNSRDAKAMAKTLRQELKLKDIELGHVECLDITAKMCGYRNWNTMEAGGEEKSAVLTGLLPLPVGWEVSGSRKSAFRIGVEQRSGPEQRNAIVLEADPNQSVNNSDWCCCYPVAFAAEKYRGKTVEFSAMVQCSNLDTESFLWFRIDDEFQHRIGWIGRWEIAEDDVLIGTRSWYRQSIRISVPENAATMYFGITHYGRGKTWLADVAFGETTEKDTRIRARVPDAPQNLDLRVA